MLRTLKDFEKCAIGASDGDIGHVKDLYFDDAAWVIRYLIVDAGSWLVSRKVLISPISVQKPDWAAYRLQAAITRDQIKDSPDIDTDKPVTRQHELQHLDYYGYPTYWGGAGLWGGDTLPIEMVPGQAESVRHRDDDPHLRSCRTAVGYHIHASDGEIGHVEGFLIDDETWAIRYLVINTSNWWLGHKVLIAPQWIGGVHWSDKSVTVDLSREAVKAAPAYDASAYLDQRREASLYAHYGHPPYWEGDSMLEHRI